MHSCTPVATPPPASCRLPAGRVHTLSDTGRYLHAIGLSDRPLSAMQVARIERAALAKIERTLGSQYRGRC